MISQITPKEFFTSPDALPVSGGVDFVTSAELSAFTGTAINSGTCALVAGAQGGVARASGAATTDASGYNIQAVYAGITPASGTVMKLEARHALGNTIGKFILGWASVDTSLYASDPVTGIFIKKAAGATGAYTLYVIAGSAVITSKVLSIKASTSFRRLGLNITYTSATSCVIEVYMDGKVIDSITVAAAAPAAYMCPSWEFQSGSNVSTQTADLDYIRYLATR